MEHRVFLSTLADSEKKELRKQQFKNIKMLGFRFVFMCLPILALAKHIPTYVIIQLLIFLVVVLFAQNIMSRFTGVRLCWCGIKLLLKK